MFRLKKWILLILLFIIAALLIDVQNSRLFIRVVSRLKVQNLRRRALKIPDFGSWTTSEQLTLAGVIESSAALADPCIAARRAMQTPGCGGFSFGLNSTTHQPIGSLLFASNTLVPSLNATTFFRADATNILDNDQSAYRWDTALPEESIATAVFTNTTLAKCSTILEWSSDGTGAAIWSSKDASCSLFSGSSIQNIADSTSGTLIYKPSQFSNGKMRKLWNATPNSTITGSDLVVIDGNGSYIPVEAATLTCANEPLCAGFVMDADGQIFYKTSTDNPSTSEGLTLYTPE